MKVLLAYDGSEPSRKALKKALELTSQEKGELVILSVTESVCPVSITEKECSLLDNALRKETQNLLEKLKTEMSSASIKVKTVVKEGQPAAEILKYLKENKCDLVVLGSHGRHGAKKFFLGSVSLRVAERSPCSVWIVK
jgi:nucleotide-binding universal stress UspA family protein